MNDEYNYKTIGFDAFLQKGQVQSTEVTEDVASSNTPQISGSNLVSGVSKSPDGKLVIDWNKSEIYTTDGARKRVFFGNIEGTNTYGLRVDDRTGNKRFEASSGLQYLDIAGKQVTVSPDESTDDFHNIQDAVDYINGLGGGTVFIKSGTYTITSNINLYSNIYLIGENRETSIIDFNNSSYQFKIAGTSALHKSNILIENLQFKRRRESTSFNNATVEAILVDYLTIRNCKFTDNWNSSSSKGLDIYTGECENLLVTSCNFISSGQGIVTHLFDSIVSNCYFEDMNSYAINVMGFRNKIYGNSFNACKSYAIYTGEDIFHTIISNNSIYNHLSTGMSFQAIFNYSSIVGNILEGGSGSVDGIYFGGSVTNSSVTGNTIVNFGDDGIETHNTAYGVTITGNAITNNTGIGIEMNAADGIIAVGNILSNNGGSTHTTGSTIVEHNIV